MFGWFKKWVAPAPAIDTSRDSAREAVANAQKSLQTVEARDSQVKAITDELKSIRTVNHFAERMELAMRGTH